MKLVDIVYSGIDSHQTVLICSLSCYEISK